MWLQQRHDKTSYKYVVCKTAHYLVLAGLWAGSTQEVGQSVSVLCATGWWVTLFIIITALSTRETEQTVSVFCAIGWLRHQVDTRCVQCDCTCGMSPLSQTFACIIYLLDVDLGYVTSTVSWQDQLQVCCMQQCTLFNVGRSLSWAPCGLRGCKNGPAPFPGRMSYKATKPGLVFVLYI